MYVGFPYDLQGPAAGFAWSWVLPRAALHVGTVVLFCAWWSVTLYALQWSHRRFHGSHEVSAGMLAHNVLYSCLGALQLAAWEAVLMRLWATGRCAFDSDASVLSGGGAALRFAAHALAVPLVRELHFYLGHRLLHWHALYRFIHYTHHRNVDVEPFSGIAMSCCEHLLYFSGGLLLPLIVRASPFQFLWLAVHASISPAAAHSGFEDAWQGDQFHALHHRYRTCNYGGWGFPVDAWFGTHRAHITAAEEKELARAARPRARRPEDDPRDVKAYAPEARALCRAPARPAGSLGAQLLQLQQALLPRGSQAAFHAATCAWLAGVALAYRAPPSALRAHLAAAGLAWGPLATALLLHRLDGGLAATSSWRFPFHNEPLAVFCAHAALALAVTTVPVYAALLRLLEPAT